MPGRDGQLEDVREGAGVAVGDGPAEPEQLGVSTGSGESTWASGASGPGKSLFSSLATMNPSCSSPPSRWPFTTRAPKRTRTRAPGRASSAIAAGTS